MKKASNYTEECRNRKNHAKPYDRIQEAARIQVSFDDNWLQNQKYQAAVMKLSKNIFAILLEVSIVAGFLRYLNIWYKFYY